MGLKPYKISSTRHKARPLDAECEITKTQTDGCTTPDSCLTENSDKAVDVRGVTSLGSASRRGLSDNGRTFRRHKTLKTVADEEKKISVVGKISLIWTIISAVYAIVSTCLLIWRGWVTHTVTYVLVAVLAVYVIAFIVLIVMIVRNPRHGKRNVKLYKKLLKIFKAVANISFLAFTAVALAGMVQVDAQGVLKWIVFVASLLVAAVQLGLNIALLVMKLVQMAVAKKFKVEIVRFVDGRRQKKNLSAKIQENKYKNE